MTPPMLPAHVPHPPGGGVVVLTRMDALLTDFHSAKYLHPLGLRVNIWI
jgi:hypothetical protein